MDAPQSDADIKPIEAQLRLLDAGLRIQWNPRAFYVSAKYDYDAEGQRRTQAPEKWEGRWQVVKLPDGDKQGGVIYVVREDYTEAYKPVGEWLVTFFQKWDAGQRHFIEERNRTWAENDRTEERALVLSDERGAEEALEEMHHRIGGNYYIGRGFGNGRRTKHGTSTES
jgi:hypothetical protein